MKLSKGVELPMNTLVVVAIAVIILLAMTAFFIGGFGPTSQNLQAKQDFQNWCNRWVQVNCKGDQNDYLVKKVFESYNKWQGKYTDSSGENICNVNEFTGGECYYGGQQIKSDEIIQELQSACGCWFIAPTSPETGTTPETTPTQQQGEGQ